MSVSPRRAVLGQLVRAHVSSKVERARSSPGTQRWVRGSPEVQAAGRSRTRESVSVVDCASLPLVARSRCRSIVCFDFDFDFDVDVGTVKRKHLVARPRLTRRLERKIVHGTRKRRERGGRVSAARAIHDTTWRLAQIGVSRERRSARGATPRCCPPRRLAEPRGTAGAQLIRRTHTNAHDSYTVAHTAVMGRQRQSARGHRPPRGNGARVNRLVRAGFSYFRAPPRLATRPARVLATSPPRHYPPPRAQNAQSGNVSRADNSASFVIREESRVTGLFIHYETLFCRIDAQTRRTEQNYFKVSKDAEKKSEKLLAKIKFSPCHLHSVKIE